jgi:predicted CXXCH cytochrome family protein
MASSAKAFLGLGLCALLLACGEREESGNGGAAAGGGRAENLPSLAGLPGVEAISQKCKPCHEKIYETWKNSQHGLANRVAGFPPDDEMFAGQKLETLVERWHFLKNGEVPRIVANEKDYVADMAIGESPLVQYLTPVDGGRWQTTSAAWDTGKDEWFDMLAGDDRTERDWGHWTGRGMTWNVQCAYCHMTDFRKGYDEKTDTYHSTWTEMGVGCTQCHGEIAAAADATNGCLIDRAGHAEFTPDQVMDGCATCHSRRGEMDEDFELGDLFEDHYQMALPTLPHLYYADGQVKDEDYVYGSLRMSKMGHAGVVCMDCHDPHQAEVKIPLETNAICMQCHAGGTNGRIEGATVIIETEHSHHAADNKGNSCVECHMTHTVYMGNDARRDHGFHIPDPLLTKEAGIPNACDTCHKDKTTDWSIEWVDKWYGEKMNRPERARTRAIQAAYDGDRHALEPLLAVYPQQVNPIWQATLLSIMQPWGTDARVQQLAVAASVHKEPRVRASAAGLLEFGIGQEARIEGMLRDPVKEVRLAAAWAMRTRVSETSEVGKELSALLAHGSDQPSGLHRRAQLASDREDYLEAERLVQRAVALDQTSAGGHEAYALILGRMKRPEEALVQLELAAKLQPDEPRYPYLIALAYGEMGKQAETEKYLRQVVKVDPTFDRAWYNLGLLLAGQERLDESIEAILKAEQVAAGNPDYPFARATIHFRKGEQEQAAEAAIRALQINPNHRPAAQFLRQLQQGR